MFLYTRKHQQLQHITQTSEYILHIHIHSCLRVSIKRVCVYIVTYFTTEWTYNGVYRVYYM